MHLAILRFSALGDVAMTVPVIDSLAHARRDIRITVVSRSFAAPLFAAMPENVDFVSADIYGRHKGICGMRRLAGELRRMGVTHTADMHDVLRTRALRTFLRWSGCRIAVIDKGRREKRHLIKAGATCTAALPHTIERYRRTLLRFGLDFPLTFNCLHFAQVPSSESDTPALGLAPFAAHAPKAYPLDLLCAAVDIVRQQCPGLRLFIFSSRAEAEKLRDEARKALHGAIYCALACEGLRDELAVMSRLDCMLSMDSGNAHLAALTGTRVVTLWGPTHPHAGFSAFGQSPADNIQADLPCRPCSIYGNKPCRFGDLRCMKALSPEMVADVLLKILCK